MKLELEFGTHYCDCPKFIINGIEADSGDFGEQRDLNPDIAEDYCCGDMTFTPKLCTEEILSKYNITVSEYNIIAGQLEVGLSFGNCGWCL